MKRISIFLFILSFALFGCSKDTNNSQGGGTDSKELTIFFVNDQHGQIDNFSKIKHIVDAAKEDGNVLMVCSGDIFSGNPVVDNHPEKRISYD